MAVDHISGQPPRPDEDGRQQAASVLFGPQGLLTKDMMFEARRMLKETPDLGFLKATILELPSLWPTISNAWPHLAELPALERLEQVSHFFQGGSNLGFLESESNTILCLLTVVTQIIDFWKLGQGDGEERIVWSSMQDVQGFCLGFLTAAAISCSKDETQYRSLAATAVRLATCAGAVVDIDTLKADRHDRALAIAVRWKPSSSLQDLEQIMDRHPKVCEPQINTLRKQFSNGVKSPTYRASPPPGLRRLRCQSGTWSVSCPI